ncbi:MAG: DUF4065 domain-containing protein [Lachnospiraceae bacterium]|nr:DUF4065 domain-containing protein [Lachnospiraceae bacterium]
MKTLKSEKMLCPCCMEAHEVKTVRVKENATFKGQKLSYEAVYQYCDKADELYANEAQMAENDISLKDAYRKAEGLLTSGDICNIREKYGITQSDMCTLLGWGGKTITRYESHQVQDKAHDSILKKIDQDPEWFLELLQDSRDSLSVKVYQKYYEKVTELYEAERDRYLRKAIEASYARFCDDAQLHGNAKLSLDKVVDVIRYFAATTMVKGLYKVKLMKLMWYADALSYKKRGHAITGLVYQVLPMGAVPVEHNSLISLKGVPCEEKCIGDNIAYHFELSEKTEFPSLSDDDRAILDAVIKKLGRFTSDQIVEFMHQELAYKKTAERDVIRFEYAKELQI